jgi:hypothetical protein
MGQEQTIHILIFLLFFYLRRSVQASIHTRAGTRGLFSSDIYMALT